MSDGEHKSDESLVPPTLVNLPAMQSSHSALSTSACVVVRRARVMKLCMSVDLQKSMRFIATLLLCYRHSRDFSAQKHPVVDLSKQVKIVP